MFTKDEKNLMKMLVKDRLAHFKKDQVGQRYVHPKFMVAEKEYEKFLKGIMKKLS